MKNDAAFVVFVCNWDGLSCVENAAQKRLGLSPNIKIVRVSCLSRINTGLILHAFVNGADGVMLLGCESGTCHYGIDAKITDQNVERTRSIMKMLGLKQQRLEVLRLKRGEGENFVKSINEFINRFEDLEIVKF
jgi:coenzyme F420-reducing hydrogenase delta subunit